MNEQELIMDIANNLIWLVVLCLMSGLLMGWYITFTYYRQKERQREAVEVYKKKVKANTPPPIADSDLTKVQKALNVLQRIVDRYHIEWNDSRWDYVEDIEIKKTSELCQQNS